MKILLVLLTLGLVGLLILAGLTLLWDTDPTRWPHRWAILDAFDGQVDPTAGGKYQFECLATAWSCEDILPKLPRATKVKCTHWMKSWGACCMAYFEDRYSAEIHIYRERGGKYLIRPRLPSCRVDQSDLQADHTEAEPRYEACLDHWGLDPRLAVSTR